MMFNELGCSMSLADELWQETKGQRGVGLFLLFEPIR